MLNISIVRPFAGLERLALLVLRQLCFLSSPCKQNNCFFQKAITLGSLMPVIRSSGLSNTRKAARLAVYEATIIMANPAHTMPRIRAEKLRGAPGQEGGTASRTDRKVPLNHTLNTEEGHRGRIQRKGLTFSNARVQQNSPGKPHCR